MLVDFENVDYIKVCPQAGLMTNPNNVWGYIKGDIAEQKDLMELIGNLEVGITPEQIALLQNVEKQINEINASLDMKVDVGEVYTKSEVDDKIDNIDVDVDLTGYATENWVKQQGYLTEHQSLTDYYTKTEIDNKGYLTEHQSLTDYYTKSEIDNKGYLIEHQSLDNYYNKSEVDDKIDDKLDINKIWSGTQSQWDALSTTQQNSYIIAMIQQ